MKKKYVFLLFFFLLIKSLQAQVQLSSYAEISIVTGNPGTELYEAFGHSAIRIKDPVLQLDIIYNYGIFDFNAPNFYTNFVKGKLLYKLARYDFKYFFNNYKRNQQGAKQQVLNLTQIQKQAFFSYLENNALPENASYFYDPYFNNCATKLRDITTFILGNKVDFKSDKIEKNLTFRQLMDREIPWNTWGSFGINLALGNKLDKVANSNEYMYLPDYVYRIFKESTVYVNNQPEKLVKREDILLNFKEKEQNILVLNPFLIFSFIALLGIFITYKDLKKNKRTKWLDFILLFVTGLVGILIVFLWFFTNHSTTPNNFNFLWAFAPNIIIAFFMLKNRSKQWLIVYFKSLSILVILIPMVWVFGIQSFPIPVIPFLALLVCRYLFLSMKLNTKTS